MINMPLPATPPGCSCCHKPYSEVEFLFKSAASFHICDGCVESTYARLQDLRAAKTHGERS